MPVSQARAATVAKASTRNARRSRPTVRRTDGFSELARQYGRRCRILLEGVGGPGFSPGDGRSVEAAPRLPYWRPRSGACITIGPDRDATIRHGLRVLRQRGSRDERKR